MLNDESYLLLCFGRSYIQDAKDLIDTLRHFKDHRNINIVVLPQDYEYAINSRLFHNVISLDIANHPLYDICQTKFEKFCLLPRLELYRFLTTKYTIVLDTDILCAYYTNNVWKYCKSIDQNIIMLGSKNNSTWHWGHWGKICNNLNIKPQETHGGFFFLKKSQELEKFFLDAKECFLNYDSFGMLKLYQNGAVDEPCFSYAFDKNNLMPIEFGEFPIMTFNLHYAAEIPTKNLTEQRQKKTMYDYIPYIHMFEKNNTKNFKSLKEKILSYES